MFAENYDDVIRQMEAFGLTLRDRDRPLKIDTARRVTCGKGGKWWYRLYFFAPNNSHRRFVVGSFGSYKDGQAVKIEWDREGLSEETLARFKAEQAAARERERRVAEESAANAALSAVQLWGMARREGESEYLVRKGVEPESCRFLAETVRIARRDPRDRPIVLPPGTLVLPLIRYDKPRAEALRGLQFIKPDGFKIFTEGFGKNGCCIRLGQVDGGTRVVLVCEGYATGLSIRMATGRRWPVYVCLDAYNLVFAVEILRALHPHVRLLICADDDWKTKDHDGPNPGRNKARAAARTTPGCDFLAPVFSPATRQEKDTDFNDLHQREGLAAVERQLLAVLQVIERGGLRGR